MAIDEYGIELKIGIEGLQELQRQNQKMLAALEPRNAPEKALQYITAGLLRYAITITDVLTGALRASHRAGYFNYRGVVFIDPGAVNPFGDRPVVYGEYVHARGGSHAFYERTVREAGEGIMRTGLSILDRELWR